MLHFIYTYAEHTPRNGHTHKSVRIYRMVNGRPRLVAERTDTFVGEFQLVMEALEANRCLPKCAFERHGDSNSYRYSYASSLEDAGIAGIYRVT